MLTFVDVATAQTAPGVRIVVSGLVPSPWSEATKGLFRLAQVPVLAVRRLRETAAIDAWTGVDHVPVVFVDGAPPRMHWAAITALAARLAAPDVLLPSSLTARAEHMGLLELIAGEEGLGWNARLAMLEAGFASDGARGFPPAVTKYLAARYGHRPGLGADVRARVGAQLALLDARLGDGEYVAGARPGAVDVYLATFLTPLAPPTEADWPGVSPTMRRGFVAAHEELGALVTPRLWAHRTRMLERHLGPITV